MSAGLSIWPAGPTMARRRSRMAGSIILASGVLVSGMLLSGVSRLFGKGGRSTRCRGAAQSVVDGGAQALLGNGHDGDGRVLRPVERSQHGEQVGRGLEQVALRAEVQAGYATADEGVRAERQQRFIGGGVMGVEPHRATGSVMAGELAWGLQARRVQAEGCRIGAGRL